MITKIPFLDLRASYLELKAELDEACLRVIVNTFIIDVKRLASDGHDTFTVCDIHTEI